MRASVAAGAGAPRQQALAPPPVPGAGTVAPDRPERAVLPVAVPVVRGRAAQGLDDLDALGAHLLAHFLLHHPRRPDGERRAHLVRAVVGAVGRAVVRVALPHHDAASHVLLAGHEPLALVQARHEAHEVRGLPVAAGESRLAIVVFGVGVCASGRGGSRGVGRAVGIEDVVGRDARRRRCVRCPGARRSRTAGRRRQGPRHRSVAACRHSCGPGMARGDRTTKTTVPKDHGNVTPMGRGHMSHRCPTIRTIVV